MTITDRIEINPNVMLGKPVIRGTRITVELILRKLSEGATVADLLDAYPRLTPDDIQAAIGYAADTVAHEETVVLERSRSVQAYRGASVRENPRKRQSPTSKRRSRDTSRPLSKTSCRSRRDNPFAQVVVPDHRELDRGTLRAILRQAGIGVEDFLKLL